MKQKHIAVLTSVIITALIVIGAGIYIGLFSSGPVQARAIDTYATAESVDTLSDAMNEFACGMYAQLGPESEENVFFSPYSIFVALAMTYEGAREDTADEMKSVLGFEQNDEVSLCSFGRIYNLLNIDAEYTLKTANALWTQKDYSFLEDYLSFIENYYMGKATDVDYSQPADAVEIINTWIEDNTNGKIEEMLSVENIHPATKLILSNAIYFKGTWATQFDVEDTVDREFTLSSGDTVEIPTMVLAGSEERFEYYETDEVQILELPYEGDAVSMMIVLPKENDLSVAEGMLTKENIDTWVASLVPTTVNVYLPKFTFETEYKLKDMLIEMGMPIAFGDGADFSGMTGARDLTIDKVLHNAFVEVNEEGTEAAAATTVHMREMAAPVSTVFDCDHPFVFLLRHKESGVVLFMGNVIDPSD